MVSQDILIESNHYADQIESTVDEMKARYSQSPDQEFRASRASDLHSMPVEPLPNEHELAQGNLKMYVTGGPMFK